MDSGPELALSYLNFIPEPFQGLIIGWHKNTGRHFFLLPPCSIAALSLGHRPAVGKRGLLVSLTHLIAWNLQDKYSPSYFN